MLYEVITVTAAVAHARCRRVLVERARRRDADRPRFVAMDKAALSYDFMGANDDVVNIPDVAHVRLVDVPDMGAAAPVVRNIDLARRQREPANRRCADAQGKASYNFV